MEKSTDNKGFEFIPYFELEWLIKHLNWYEGATASLPSNNGV